MRPVIIITLFVVFILAMDLYALRGIQYLFSPGRMETFCSITFTGESHF